MNRGDETKYGRRNMASKETGFHPNDADWTRGRAQAVADSEAIARAGMWQARRVTLSRAALDQWEALS